jgi:alkanesulfonate monooxygenase SsuD/methylene tetrahydromethanopterin reductase-like flavin-dependent oxidoreductase (luciferase family)
MSVQFGFCLPIFAWPGGDFFRTPNYRELDARATMEMGVRAEQLGYDSLWVADHLMLGKDDAILEGWTVLSALAGATDRVKLGMIHLAVLFRHPSLIAKMAATLDQISGGRLIHFMDCGFDGRANEHVNYSLGWDPDENVRLDMLDEATQIILAMWSDEQPVTWRGKHYRVDGAVNHPLTVQRPHPPIWFGEVRGIVLDLCAKYGQGWNTVPASLDELQRRLDLLRVACDRNGRDFNEIKVSLETQIVIGSDLDDVRRQLRGMIELGKQESPKTFAGSLANSSEMRSFVEGASDVLPPALANEWIAGTPDMVEARLREYVELGVSHFMFWFQDAPDRAGMELFARDVMPRFRSPIRVV